MEHENRCSLSFRSLFVSRAKSQLTPVPTWQTWLVNYIQSRQNGGGRGGGGVGSTLWRHQELKWVRAQVICADSGAETLDSLGQIAFQRRKRHQGSDTKDTITDSSLAVVRVCPHSCTVVAAASVSKLNLSPDESKWVYLVQLSQLQESAQKPGSSFWLQGCESSQVQSLQPVNAKQESSWLSTFGHSAYQSGAKRFRFAEA